MEVLPNSFHLNGHKQGFHPQASVQPRPQSLLGVQNGGAKKTLANSRSRVSKNIGDWLILWSRDLLFARVFFAPTRHLESGDGPGDEVGFSENLVIDSSADSVSDRVNRICLYSTSLLPSLHATNDKNRMAER